ncbi:hypothetical protein AAE478_005446 [Parahypoxylon ruwenzoriense]
MTSLVTDFLVNPVIRQARRFSRSSSNLPTSSPVSPPQTTRDSKESQDDAISETEEDSYLDDDVEGSVLSSTSSRSSVHPYSRSDAADPTRHIGHSDNGISHTDSRSPDTSNRGNDPRHLDNQDESISTSNPNTMAERLIPSGGSLSPPRRERRKSLPEDDGMGVLRKRIFTIQAQDIKASEKASLMHQLLLEGYTKSKGFNPVERPLTPSSPSISEQRHSQGPLDSFKFWHNISGEAGTQEEFDLTPEDLQPTFAPPRNSSEDASEDAEEAEDSDYRPLGCEHYRRNVKLQCSTCNRWYTCRFCHDKVEDHNLIRKDTRNMLCMFCGTAQRAGDVCVSCGQKDHKCIERSTDCDCPICGDYMFTSPKAVCFMKCGHSIHRQCLDQHMKVAYKCPICNKSLANMELQFRNLDIAIETQPMPAEFQDTRALILCNDCSAKSSVKYHWLGLKCGVCSSYNTAQLQIRGMADEVIETDLLRREVQLPEFTASRGAVVTRAGESDGARDIRRRHSSNVARSTAIEPIMDPYDRLARSVSPPPNNANSWNPPAGYMVETEDDERDDIIGFWSRVPRSIASNEDEDDVGASGEESISSSEDEEGEEGEEEEEEVDDFELLGHR